MKRIENASGLRIVTSLGEKEGKGVLPGSTGTGIPAPDAEARAQG